MDLAALAKEGAGYAIAAFMVWLLLLEKKEHREDNKSNADMIYKLQNEKLEIAIEYRKDQQSLMPPLAAALNNMSEKFDLTKGVK